MSKTNTNPVDSVPPSEGELFPPEDLAQPHIPEPRSSQSVAGPSLTLFESGVNPGQVLKQAREKLGLSLADVSVQTKINVFQLESIERGDVSQLPPGTFAKAFIKSYCRAVRVEAEPVLAAFGMESASASPAKAGAAHKRTPESTEPNMPNSSRRLSALSFDRKSSGKKIVFVVLGLVVVLTLAVYVPAYLSGADSPEDQIAVSNDTPPAQTSDDELFSRFANSSATSENGVASTDTASQAAFATGAASSELLNESVPVPGLAGQEQAAVAAPSPSSESVFPAVVQENAKLAPKNGNPPGAEQPGAPGAGQGPLPGQSASGQQPAGQQPASAPTEVLSGPQPRVIGAGEAGVTLSFTGESWVTVRDGRDAVLLSQLNPAGDSLQVRGQPPFKLIIGNAKNVKLRYNNRPVNLEQSLRGEVARVTLD
ncbi:MAG: DUF4115 domain-containing protein [Limnobacter sp.]|nr:DUF4115 domain-containing protein [Limnobacter sp.]